MKTKQKVDKPKMHEYFNRYDKLITSYGLTVKEFFDYLQSVARYCAKFAKDGIVSYVEFKRLACNQTAVFNGKNDYRYVYDTSSIEEFAKQISIEDIKLAKLSAIALHASVGKSNAAAITEPFLNCLIKSKLFKIADSSKRSTILKSLVEADDISIKRFNINYIATARRAEIASK